MRSTLLAFVLVATFAGGAEARQLALGASFQEGITTDTSGVHRGTLGGAVDFRRVGIDAALQLEIWDPYSNGDVGTKIQAAGATVGARVMLLDEDHFVGPHVAIGLGYLRLRQEYSQKRVNELLGFAGLGPNAFGLRGGLGYGFRTTADVTVSIRLDVNYWIIEEGEPPFMPQYADESTNAMSFQLVLEMMRFW